MGSSESAWTASVASGGRASDSMDRVYRYHGRMRKVSRRLLILALAAGLALLGQPRERPVRHPVRGTRGAVAAGTDFASNAAMRIYAAGGNAVDAGVAAMFAAAVTEYSHFGFGGEAPLLIRTPSGRVVSIAGVGTMPKLATAAFFRERKLQPGEVQHREPNGLARMVPVAGILPALVPGMVDAGLLALKEFGVRSFADVIQPAIELADATPLDESRASALARSRRFHELWPSSRAVFSPGERPLRPGDLFRQPDLARTLHQMANAEQAALARGMSRTAAIDAVRDFFYRGDIARRIGEFSERNGGLLRYEDLAEFKLELEEPVCTAYRGYRICKPGFWSQGPAMIETLNLLEGFNLRAMSLNSPDYLHTLAEALKLGYANRDAWYGDPRFTIEPRGFLSKDYAAQRRGLIGTAASLDFRPDEFGGRPAFHPSRTVPIRTDIDDDLMARDTTCVNAIDKEGWVFSATPSGAWLPAVIAGDTGIPLTQRAQSFYLIEGHPNELAPGKRPRVTLSPTLVTTAEGRPFAALSTPGGDNQDQSLLQVFLNVVEFDLNTQAATEAPRFQTRHLVSSFDNHGMNPGDLLLDERIRDEVAVQLKQRGHRVGRRSRYASGAAPVIILFRENGVIEAGADPYGYRSAQAW